MIGQKDIPLSAHQIKKPGRCACGFGKGSQADRLKQHLDLYAGFARDAARTQRPRPTSLELSKYIGKPFEARIPGGTFIGVCGGILDRPRERLVMPAKVDADQWGGGFWWHQVTWLDPKRGNASND